MVNVPTYGGKITEGIVGTPRFINPLLAISDADRDLTSLVYSGLLKAKPDGSFVPDLARTYSISPDGLIYTFIIRDDAVFHDGTPVTADDVVYTIEKAQDGTLKSPRRINWEGVSVQKTNDHEIVFSLKQPYAPFITNLTLGILPKHIWKNIDSDQFSFSLSNINAIGSGPYKITSISQSSDGIPDKVTLSTNSKYSLGKPYIKNIVFKFYQNKTDLVDALKKSSIESAGNIDPETAMSISKDKIIMRAPLTRIFGVFFNQNERELLAHKEVRKALTVAINKDEIISIVLKGYGTPASGPLPLSSTENSKSSIEEAQTILEKAGWKKNPETGIYELKNKTTITSLSFSLSTANIPELVESAKIIEETWKKIGVEIDVRVFEPSDLNQSIIRPRKYDSLLFGIVTGRNPDPYPFWHSSQRNDPGLNIALYTNIKVDKYLETMRSTSDSEQANEARINFEKEIAADSPAIFLWSPDFIYTVPKKIQGISLGEITTPSDRFLNVRDWYIEMDRVWRVFVKER